ARELTPQEFIDRLAKLPLLNQPGTTWEYGVSTDVLGRVVEVVAGKPLGQVLAERIFRPLKMTDTGFVVTADKQTRLAQGSAGDYNWAGAFGTAVWVDPKEELTVVVMVQAPGPIRVHYRQLLKSLVLQAIPGWRQAAEPPSARDLECEIRDNCRVREAAKH